MHLQQLMNGRLKLCYIALDYDKQLKNAQTSPNDFEQQYELPDGQVINVDSEVFKCTEIFFKAISWSL